MGLLGLLWKRKWVLVVAALVSAGAAAPSLLSAPRNFTSRAEVYIPRLGPVEVGARDTAPIEIQLDAYAENQLPSDVRSALALDAAELTTLAVNRVRDGSTFTIEAEARSRPVAFEAAQLAADRLIARSNQLAEQSIEAVRDLVAETLEPLQTERASLEAQRGHLLARAERLKAKGLLKEVAVVRDQLLTLRTHIEANEAQQLGLIKLVEAASAGALQREVASSILSGPSPPQTNFALRAVETVGLALLVGVVVATLVIIWLERRVLRPSPPDGDESRRAVGDGMFHPRMPTRDRTTQREDAHTKR